VLIQGYVTVNATPEEHRKLNQWMGRDNEHRKLVREIQEIWNLTSDEDFEVNVQDLWEYFQARIRQISSMMAKDERNISRRSSGGMVHVFRVAAFFLVALITGFFFQHIVTN